jgi:tetratricopeptide (TPR) repeat protein
MRHVWSLAAVGTASLWLAALVAQAGPREDCLAKQDDPDVVIPACTELIRWNPKDDGAHTNRGNAFLQKRDWDSAMADYDAAIKLNKDVAIKLSPGLAQAYNGRGSVYWHKGDLESALADFSESIRLGTLFNPAHYGRGNVHAYNGDFERALADYDKLHKNSPLYRIGRGEIFSTQGDYDRAIDEFDRAIFFARRSAPAYAGRGRAYGRKRDYAKAMADLDEAISLAPGFVTPYVYRAGIYEAKADRKRAIADYMKALNLRPESRWETDRQAEARHRLAALGAAPPVAASTSASAPARESPAAKLPAPVVPPAAVWLGRRVALVIGNAGYRVGPLANPRNDATAVAEALEKQLRFDKVTLRLDLGREGLLAALGALSRDAAGAGLALVYYAGHATERRGKNYLIPIDARLDNAGDLGVETVLLDTVLEQIEGATKLKLVILDSCRNNMFPLADSDRSRSRGLIRVEPDKNTLVAYAAKDGTVALDGTGRHSPYTEALLKRIATPGLEVRFLFGHIRDDVLAATGQRQEPYVYGSLGGQQIVLLDR